MKWNQGVFWTQKMASKWDACKTENWLKSVTPLKVSFMFASPHDPETLQRIPIQCWGGHAERCPSTVVRCKFQVLTTRVKWVLPDLCWILWPVYVISSMVEPHYLHRTNVCVQVMVLENRRSWWTNWPMIWMSWCDWCKKAHIFGVKNS